MAKLTKTFIEKASAPASGVRLFWDDSVKGYGLRVSAAGKKVLFAQGRIHGKAVVVTIGAFGLYTEDQARKKAQSLLQDMREGIDPRDTKKAEEISKITLRQVADAYFARPGMLKESSKAEMNRHIDQVFAAWKDKPIVSITPEMCRKRYDEMYHKGLRGSKGAPTQARISMVTIRTLINWVRETYKRLDGTPLITANPVDTFKTEWKRNKPKERTRHIDRRKVGEVWHMLTTTRTNLIAAQQREEVNPQNADKQAGVDLVLFLLLTGARRNEGAMLTWDRVNLDDDDPTNCWWHLPDPKNRNPVWLPLSKQAASLLSSRKPPKDDKEASRYVFPSRGKAGHVMDTRAPLERIAKIVSNEPTFRIAAHDLRRTFVTLGVKACRLDLSKLELLTNHVPTGITARHYLSTSDLKDFYPEVQAIADYIEQEMRVAPTYWSRMPTRISNSVSSQRPSASGKPFPSVVILPRSARNGGSSRFTLIPTIRSAIF